MSFQWRNARVDCDGLCCKGWIGPSLHVHAVSWKNNMLSECVRLEWSQCHRSQLLMLDVLQQVRAYWLEVWSPVASLATCLCSLPAQVLHPQDFPIPFLIPADSTFTVLVNLPLCTLRQSTVPSNSFLWYRKKPFMTLDMCEISFTYSPAYLI